MATTKLAIEDIISIINTNVKDAETKKGILEDIKKIQAEKEAEKEDDKENAEPKQKNKHVFFVRKDENGKYADAGFLAKVSQNSDNSTVLSRLQTAAAQQNDAKKNKKSNRGRKSKGGVIATFRDFFYGSARKFTKPNDIQPLKELVEVIVLPTEEIDFSK